MRRKTQIGAALRVIVFKIDKTIFLSPADIFHGFFVASHTCTVYLYSTVGFNLIQSLIKHPGKINKFQLAKKH